jgi:hypothetical protein
MTCVVRLCERLGTLESGTSGQWRESFATKVGKMGATSTPGCMTFLQQAAHVSLVETSQKIFLDCMKQRAGIIFLIRRVWVSHGPLQTHRAIAVLVSLREWRLLVIGGHHTHTTVDFMWECFLNKIYILFLPAHSTHFLQPLDVAVFAPLKKAFRRHLGKLRVYVSALLPLLRLLKDIGAVIATQWRRRFCSTATACFLRAARHILSFLSIDG